MVLKMGLCLLSPVVQLWVKFIVWIKHLAETSVDETIECVGNFRLHL